MRLVHWLMVVALFTASCDLILVLRVAGTLRLANLIMMVLLIAAAGRVIQRQAILWPRAGGMLALWCVLQGVLIARSDIPAISLNIYTLLLLTVAGIFAVLQLYGRSGLVEPLMRAYLGSYVFVACFGLFQFVTPALHLGTYLVQAWIVHGLIPRINGFNYEPSYFATYLVMGWIMLIDLRVRNARMTAGRRWKVFTVLVTLVFFLSSSRTAWVFLLVEGVARAVPPLLRRVRRQVERLRRGRLIVSLPRAKWVVGAAFVLVGFAAAYSGVNRLVNPLILLSGTGLGGTSSQTVTDRLESYRDTFEVFREHPLLGLGLGGTGGRVAQLQGAQVSDMADYRIHQPFPVPLDVLASSGLLGVIPFAWFFWAITVGERDLLRRYAGDERAKWLHALIRAMIYEWLILVVDQNLLRVYFWFHVTMLVVIGYNLRYQTHPATAPESLATL